MPVSASALFPFKQASEGNLQRTLTVEQTINSAIKCFIFTDKNSRLGNAIGSRVPALLHQLLPVIRIQSEEQEILLELSQQFPEVKFVEVSLVQGQGENKPVFRIGIKYTTPITNLVELNFSLN